MFENITEMFMGSFKDLVRMFKLLRLLVNKNETGRK